MVQAVQKKLTEDPSEFLEKVYHVYKKYTELDPPAPESFRVVNMTFISQSEPDIGKKLQKLKGGIRWILPN